MNQKHEWLDQFGIVCGIVAGPDGTIQATDEQMADEILRLSAALAKASEERLTLARIVDEMTPRNEIGDCQFLLAIMSRRPAMGGARMAELKPVACPFCGASNVIVRQGETCKWVVPACAECDAQGPPVRVRYVAGPISDSDTAEAIAEWNRRPSVPPVGEREFRLAEAVVYLLGDLHEVKDDKPDGWADSIVAEARAILSSTAPDPASEPSDLLKIECSIGGGYEMPDGRSFWIDGPVAREMTRRVAAALGLQVKESR